MRYSLLGMAVCLGLDEATDCLIKMREIPFKSMLVHKDHDTARKNASFRGYRKAPEYIAFRATIVKEQRLILRSLAKPWIFGIRVSRLQVAARDI